MTSDQIVTSFLQAIERKDIDAAVAALSESISYENMPMRPIVGPEAVAKALHGFVDAAEEVDWQIVRQDAVGNVVYNERVDRFRFSGGWLELPVAGVFELDAAGKITLWRDYFDMASYQRQYAEVGNAD
jgi:limonene-1,2-epoxide hydrolase